MDHPQSPEEADPSVLPFLEAAEEADSEKRLTEIISEQTESTIKGIVRSKFRVSLSPTDTSHVNQDALEIVGDIQAGLLARLRQIRKDNYTTIGNLRGYVASIAFNACNQHLRNKYPLRWRLKNRLRYLLTHRPGFEFQEKSPGEWLCGYAAEHDRKLVPASPSQVRRLLEDKQVLDVAAQQVASFDERRLLLELSRTVFDHLKAPISFDDLVGIIAELSGLKEQEPLRTDYPGNKGADLTGLKPQVQTEAEQRAQLQKLWAEICELPLRHRTALLLNLRDKQGADTIAALPLARIASIRQIAAVLGFSPEHFANVWSELPWDDATIAKHLGLSRQQVINLRSSARARLARRMKGA